MLEEFNEVVVYKMFFVDIQDATISNSHYGMT